MSSSQGVLLTAGVDSTGASNPGGFVLDPQFVEQLTISWAYCYSRQWNQRRIEAHHYIAWVLVIIATFHDMRPRFAVCPQFTFSTLDDETLDVSRDSTHRVAVPKAREIKQNLENALKQAIDQKSRLEDLLTQAEEISQHDEQSPLLQEINNAIERNLEAGNPNVPSHKSLTNFLATETGLSRTPDFVVVLFLGLHCRQTGTPYPMFSIPKLDAWETLRISASIIPSVWEIKRNPSRELDKEAYESQLFTTMNKASEQAEEQATLALKSQPTLTHIILVVASGEWWMWRVMERPEPAQLNHRLAQIKGASKKRAPDVRLKQQLQKTKKYIFDPKPNPVEDDAVKNDETFKPNRDMQVPQSNRALRSKMKSNSTNDNNQPVGGGAAPEEAPQVPIPPEEGQLGRNFPRHLHINSQAEVYPGNLDSFRTFVFSHPGWISYIRMGSEASDQSLELIHDLHKEFIDAYDASNKSGENEPKEQSPPQSPTENENDPDSNDRQGARSPTQKMIGSQTK